jgi:hypothetical protein
MKQIRNITFLPFHIKKIRKILLNFSHNTDGVKSIYRCDPERKTNLKLLLPKQKKDPDENWTNDKK